MPGRITSQQPTTTSVTRLWTIFAVLAAALWTISLSTILLTISRTGQFLLGDKFPAFEDITIYDHRFEVFHSAAFFRAVIHSPYTSFPPTAFAYPPVAALIYAGFYAFPHPDILFTVIVALWTIFLFAGTWLLLRRRLASTRLANFFALTLPLFSFPLVFLADRSNIELFVWMLLISAGVFLYLKDRTHSAAALIGIAACIKLYPVLLLGLFLSRRRDLPAFFWGIAVCVATTFFAVWFAGPTIPIAWHGFVDGVVRFKSQHAEAARAVEAVVDHSLFAPLKIQYLDRRATPAQWALPYYVIAGTTALALFVFRVRKLPLLNRLTFLTVAMVLLPPVSYEYTLTHLYLPLLLLLLTLLHQPPALTCRTQLGAFGCFLFLMLPLGLLANGTFLLAGQLQAAALVLLAILTCAAPWPLALKPAHSSA